MQLKSAFILQHCACEQLIATQDAGTVQAIATNYNDEAWPALTNPLKLFEERTSWLYLPNIRNQVNTSAA